MTVKRLLLAILLALGLGLASAAPVSAAVLTTGTTQAVTVQVQLDPPPTCVYVPGNYFNFFDSFHCQTPPPHFPFGDVQVTDLGTCFILTQFQDNAHSPPNGWGNAISSAKNISPYEVRFYDTANCSGATLFGMDPYTMRATLVPAANNKASSFKFVL